jgi:hypothetical protein
LRCVIAVEVFRTQAELRRILGHGEIFSTYKLVVWYV